MAEFQVGEQLGFVHRRCFPYSLQLDENEVLHHHIDTVSDIEAYASILDGKGQFCFVE